MKNGSLAKAVSETRRILQLVAREETAVRRAFGNFVADTRSPAVQGQVRELLEQGRVSQALGLVDQHVARMADVIPRIVTDAGQASMDDLGARFGRQIEGARAGALDFDPGNERASDIIDGSRLQFIRDFGREQRATTRAAVSEALQSGAGPREAARQFRDSMGLTQTQQNAVDNYRRLLETRSPEALTRTLRDRRFDRTVAEALEGEEPLERAQIDRMVERYRERMVSHRADTIARTEAHRAVEQARQESIEQMLEQTGLEPDDVRRVWNATQDHRTRDSHFAMDGQTRGLYEAFRTPSGIEIMYPGDPDAPPEETINCRCVLSTVIV